MLLISFMNKRIDFHVKDVSDHYMLYNQIRYFSLKILLLFCASIVIFFSQVGLNFFILWVLLDLFPHIYI